MKLYKLTDKKGCTYGKTKWAANITHSVEPCSNPELCTSKVIHAYKNINLGLLLNPIHSDIQDPIIWKSEGEICIEDWGKVGCFELTTLKKLETPKWYTSKSRPKVQIQFAILCAEKVLHIFEDIYPQDDRPRMAIQAAKDCLKNINHNSASDVVEAAAHDAANTAVYTAAHAAAHAANAATYAITAAAACAYDDTYTTAHAAAFAANAAHTANAAESAAYGAANAAEAATYAAARAANAAESAAYGAAHSAAAATYNAATACANNNTYSAAYAAAYAADHAANAADVASYAADAATYAAEAATAVDVAESVATKINNIIVDNTINFGAIADQAVEIIMVGQKKKKEKKKIN